MRVKVNKAVVNNGRNKLQRPSSSTASVQLPNSNKNKKVARSRADIKVEDEAVAAPPRGPDEVVGISPDVVAPHNATSSVLQSRVVAERESVTFPDGIAAWHKEDPQYYKLDSLCTDDNTEASYFLDTGINPDDPGDPKLECYMRRSKCRCLGKSYLYPYDVVNRWAHPTGVTDDEMNTLDDGITPRECLLFSTGGNVADMLAGMLYDSEAKVCYYLGSHYSHLPSTTYYNTKYFQAFGHDLVKVKTSGVDEAGVVQWKNLPPGLWGTDFAYFKETTNAEGTTTEEPLQGGEDTFCVAQDADGKTYESWIMYTKVVDKENHIQCKALLEKMCEKFDSVDKCNSDASAETCVWTKKEGADAETCFDCNDLSGDKFGCPGISAGKCEFDAETSLCRPLLVTTSSSTTTTPAPEGMSMTTIYIIAVSAVGAILIGVVLVILCLCCGGKKKGDPDSKASQDDKSKAAAEAAGGGARQTRAASQKLPTGNTGPSQPPALDKAGSFGANNSFSNAGGGDAFRGGSAVDNSKPSGGPASTFAARVSMAQTH
ncbi:unnamed protein product [Amoebophrya sp. A120]|nr:unnamed protein product [Amoebophrya sp. A120]|eukprot:GSA120T00008720001.1